MGMIPDKVYFQVESRLKGRWTAIQKAEKALEKARERAMATSSLQISPAGNGTRSRSSRTERSAMIVVAAEEALDIAWKWEEVFRKLDSYFPPDKSSEGFVASLMYGNGMSQEDVCRFTHCARQTIRRRRDRYINYCALIAAEKGLIRMEGGEQNGNSDQKVGSAEEDQQAGGKGTRIRR